MSLYLQDSLSPALLSILSPTVPSPDVPAWVTALAAPSGDLPSTVLDFKNGRYWVGGAAVDNLDGVLVHNPDWGAYDDTALVAGLGLGAFGPGANNAQPTVNRDLLGDVLTAGCTFVAIAELTATGDQTDVLVLVEFVALPDFGSEYSGKAAWIANPSDTPTANSGMLVVNQVDFVRDDFVLPATTTGVHKQAVNVTADGVAQAIDGATRPPVLATVAKDTPFTDLAIATYATYSATAVLSYLTLLAIYRTQPDGDLAALST